MAAKPCSHVATCDCFSGVSRYPRDLPPAHYTLKIDSYSQFLQSLSKTDPICYISQIFEASGYKWKLSLYPNGDKERNGEGYISMFLTLEDTKSLPLGWEVNVMYKFFVFDQIRNKYLSIQDASGKIYRYDARKTEWGISQLLPSCDFNDTEKGFLIQDKCIFGAEIFVVRCTHVGEYISPLKNFEVYKYKWEVFPFSSKTEKKYYSDIFTAGNFKWKLSYYPKGDSRGEGDSLSFYLKKGDSRGEGDSLSFYLNVVDIKASERVYAEFKFCIHDQCNSKHQECEWSHWFSGSDAGWGFPKFLYLTELYNPSKGFVVKDKVIFEVQITKIITLQSLF